MQGQGVHLNDGNLSPATSMVGPWITLHTRSQTREPPGVANITPSAKSSQLQSWLRGRLVCRLRWCATRRHGCVFASNGVSGQSYYWGMARCTAPVQGHRTESGAAACPMHGGRSTYGDYSQRSYSPVSRSPTSRTRASGGTGPARRATRPTWSPSNSAVTYTADQVRALTSYRRAVEAQGQLPELRDLFLCHAWDDRRDAATELSDLLEAEGVSVWFSEKDILLGQPFMREIDRGLAKSRAGLVLVTPALLERVSNRGISDKELSELLARDQLIPVVHGTTYDEVRKVSPLLGSRNGLDTAEDSMTTIAVKIAELVNL